MFCADAAREYCRMLAVAILVASLGIVDSLNPVTILVAVYLGSTREARRPLTGFVIGVFSVYLVGGLVLVLGSGERSDMALAGVDTPWADFVALAAGATAMIVASLLWVRRRRWGHPRLPDRALHPGSTLALGAAMTAVDLPTAFPYFGAIGVIVGSGVSLVAELLLLVMFNVLYVLPPVLVLAAHVVFGGRCESALSPARGAIERYAAPLLAAATLAVGCVLFVRGASGLIG
jgi:hypothetical protein